jgi:hypothetical protein
MLAQIQNVQSSVPELELLTLLRNLGIGVVLSLLLRWHFERFGTTLGNRREFGTNFPIVMLTTALVIAVVKHSMALSLGLVGALSIVRFRTPIKEPEELGYLFLAIAGGLGLGADQWQATAVALLAILLVVTLIKRKGAGAAGRSLYLTIGWNTQGRERALDQLSAVIGRHVAQNDLRRLDAQDGRLDATFFVDFPNPARLSALLEELRQQCPGASITFLDQSRMPAV